MFWNDIKDIKSSVQSIHSWMTTCANRLKNLQLDNDLIHKEQDELHRRLEESIDKVDECLKNVDKLNAMINEFKGCVSLARAAFEERKSKPK
jgi:uncharacterized coiled-coil DUF342 family protein